MLDTRAWCTHPGATPCSTSLLLWASGRPQICFFKKTPQTRNLCLHFFPFCGLFLFWPHLLWVLVCGQLFPLSRYGPNK
jgi:hypothetical protein